MIRMLGTACIATDALQRVEVGVVHRRGRGHRTGIKSLNLIRTETMTLEPQRQMHHVFVGRSWMCSNKIRHQKLFFSGLKAELIKQLFKAVVATNARLHHLG